MWLNYRYEWDIGNEMNQGKTKLMAEEMKIP